MKYAFILDHQSVWPISVQCRVLKVSISAYHEYFVRRASGAQRRHLSDDALLVHIKAIHAETHAAYGWPRIWKTLLGRGIRVGYKLFAKPAYTTTEGRKPILNLARPCSTDSE